MTTPLINTSQTDYNSDYYIQVDRAISELRKSRAICTLIDDEPFLVHAAETSVPQDFPVHLIVSGARLRKLFACDEMFEGAAYSINIESPDELKDIESVFNPARAFDEEEFAGTFENAEEFAFLLKLAGIAQLLPAVYVTAIDSEPDIALRVAREAVQNFSETHAATLQKIVEATLPTPDGNVRVILFRPDDGGLEHMALCFGDIHGGAPLVRVHSSCLTGDVLSSLRCDCGDQLRLAFHQISASDGGVIVYINQEGRGIGLANKLRAYNLQDGGMDTYDANLALGFAEDERDFPLAAQILKLLQIKQIKLITNNPKKVHGMNELGIEVVQQVSAEIKAHNHNINYLETKAEKGKHIISGLKTKK